VGDVGDISKEIKSESYSKIQNPIIHEK